LTKKLKMYIVNIQYIVVFSMLSQNELYELLDAPLRELGLTDAERRLYLLSLHLGPQPIVQLAKHLGISRPNLYKVIAALEAHGLAQFSSQQRYARAFNVESPEVLRELLRAHRESLDGYDQKMTRAFPDLLALYKQGNLPTNIRVYRHKADWTNAYDDLLDEAREDFLYFGHVGQTVFNHMPTAEESWKKRRIAKGIHIKLLTFRTPLTEGFVHTDKNDLRETRFFADIQDFDTAFHIFGTKVILRQPHAGLAIRIEDEYLSHMFRSIFFAHWDRACEEPRSTKLR